MSIECVNAVRGKRFGSAQRKSVMHVLADYCDVEWSCFVGQERLAAEAEVSRRTVERLLPQLEAEGLIRREKRYGKVLGRTSDRTTIVKAAILDLPDSLAARPGLTAKPTALPAKQVDLSANLDPPTRLSLAGDPLGGPLGPDPSVDPSRRDDVLANRRTGPDGDDLDAEAEADAAWRRHQYDTAMASIEALKVAWGRKLRAAPMELDSSGRPAQP
jgi:hypothetical protein